MAKNYEKEDEDEEESKDEDEEDEDEEDVYKKKKKKPSRESAERGRYDQYTLKQNILRFNGDVANTQWWTIFGSALFASGLIILTISYSSLQIIYTLPSQYLGSNFFSVSNQVFDVGIVAAVLGFLILLYSKFKLLAMSSSVA